MILKVDIAKTQHALAQGLMWVKELPQDKGMLFDFQSPQELSFWGKDTYIPLDIAFIRDGKITEIQSITPMSTRPVRSDELCNMAIEANAGFFENNNIKVGNKISLNALNEECCEVNFSRE